MQLLRILMIVLFCNQIAFSESGIVSDRLLHAPNGERPQCRQGYENAVRPKNAENVFESLSRVCHFSGGIHLLHTLLVSDGGGAKYWFKCVGSEPDQVMFSCVFNLSNESL